MAPVCSWKLGAWAKLYSYLKPYSILKRYGIVHFEYSKQITYNYFRNARFDNAIRTMLLLTLDFASTEAGCDPSNSHD